jgi:hypothetical protein
VGARLFISGGRGGEVEWKKRKGDATRIDEGDGFPPFFVLGASTSRDLKGDADADSGCFSCDSLPRFLTRTAA